MLVEAPLQRVYIRPPWFAGSAWQTRPGPGHGAGLRFRSENVQPSNSNSNASDSLTFPSQCSLLQD